MYSIVFYISLFTEVGELSVVKEVNPADPTHNLNLRNLLVAEKMGSLSMSESESGSSSFGSYMMDLNRGKLH